MKFNKEVRDYAKKYTDMYGVEKVKRLISESIHDLSTEDDAITNINQLYFFVRVLNHIKQTY